LLAVFLLLVLALAANAYVYQNTNALSLAASYTTPSFHNFTVGGGIPSYNTVKDVFISFQFNYGNAHRLAIDMAPFGCIFDTDFVFENDCDLNIFITPNGPSGSGAALTGNYTFNDAGVKLVSNVGSTGTVNANQLYKVSANSAGAEPTTILAYINNLNRVNTFGQTWSFRFRNFGSLPSNHLITRTTVNICTKGDIYDTVTITTIDPDCPTFFVFQANTKVLTLSAITHNQPITIDMNGKTQNQVVIAGGAYSQQIKIIDSTNVDTSDVTIAFSSTSVHSLLITAPGTVKLSGDVTITNSAGFTNQGVLKSLVVASATIVGTSTTNVPFRFVSKDVHIIDSTITVSGVVDISGQLVPP